LSGGRERKKQNNNGGGSRRSGNREGPLRDKWHRTLGGRNNRRGNPIHPLTAFRIKSAKEGESELDGRQIHGR